MIKAVAIVCGYVETTTTSWLIFSARGEVPSSKKEALYSLAEYLYQEYMYKNDMNYDRDEDFFDLADFKIFMYDLHSSNASAGPNSYPFESGGPNPNGWEPWGFNFALPRQEILVIPERAEDMLVLALGELHPEIKELEDYNLPCFLKKKFEELLQD